MPRSFQRPRKTLYPHLARFLIPCLVVSYVCQPFPFVWAAPPTTPPHPQTLSSDDGLISNANDRNVVTAGCGTLTYSGEFTSCQTVLTIPGRGFPFTATLCYRSGYEK